MLDINETQIDVLDLTEDSSLVLNLALCIKGRKLFIDTSTPTNKELYYSILNQFQIDTTKADKLESAFVRFGKEIQTILKERTV